MSFNVRVIPETRQVLLTAKTDLEFIWLEERMMEIENETRKKN